jgi:ubiquinone/menaquinone biosynthesis C-methylase UbiE
MQDVKAAVRRQFGRVAEHYRVSAVHAAGEDLQRLAHEVRRMNAAHVLDAGCGAGHTAMTVAPFAQTVVAYDLTAPMLRQVEQLAAERGCANVVTRRGDVEHLPFEPASFDAVVSRYSAHHWPRPQRALEEIRRVLKPGGAFLLSDVVSPDEPKLDTFLQTVELLRDPSHVRDHTVAQWEAMLVQAGFRSEVFFTWKLPLDFQAWVKRMATPAANVAIIQSLFDGAPLEVHTEMDVQPDYRFSLRGALIRAFPV